MPNKLSPEEERFNCITDICNIIKSNSMPDTLSPEDNCPECSGSGCKYCQGIYRNKFNVTRTDGTSSPGGKHANCKYFVLDLNHDPHALPAIRAYAESCKATYPKLAEELQLVLTNNSFGDECFTSGDECPECDGSGCKYCQGSKTCTGWLARQRGEDEGYKNICNGCTVIKCNRLDAECLISKEEHDASEHRQELMSLHG